MLWIVKSKGSVYESIQIWKSRTFERIQRNFFEYTESSHSQRLVPIVWDLQMSIKQLDEWHLEHTSDLVDYIQNKADLFIQADSGTGA